MTYQRRYDEVDSDTNKHTRHLSPVNIVDKIKLESEALQEQSVIAIDVACADHGVYDQENHRVT